MVEEISGQPESELMQPTVNAVTKTSSYFRYPLLLTDTSRPFTFVNPHQTTVFNVIKPIVLLINSPSNPTSKDITEPSDSSLVAAGNALYKACAAKCPTFFQDPAGAGKISFEVLNLQRSTLDVAEDRQFCVEVKREIQERIWRIRFNALNAPGVHNLYLDHILFAFFPEHDNIFLSEMRRLCDMELGIRSVFLERSSIQEALACPCPSDSSHFTLAAHQLSMIMGGTDRDIASDTLRIFKDTMLVGLYIRESAGYPSIVSVVASFEESFTNYPASLRVLPIKDEDSEGNPKIVSSARYGSTYESNSLADYYGRGDSA